MYLYFCQFVLSKWFAYMFNNFEDTDTDTDTDTKTKYTFLFLLWTFFRNMMQFNSFSKDFYSERNSTFFFHS